MRCSRVKHNKCWERVKSELTHISIRFIIHFLHVHVVDVYHLERVGLCSCSFFLLRVVTSIMPHLTALETLDLTQVLGLCRVAVATSIPTVVVVLLAMIRVAWSRCKVVVMSPCYV